MTIFARFVSKKVFPDGSVLRPSSKESLNYRHGNISLDIQFHHDNSGIFHIYLPGKTNAESDANLRMKIKAYCDDKHYRFVFHPEDDE